MRPLRLILENFAKYRGEHELDFSQINLAVLTGPNGAGKSTLAVGSIRWALFGATPGSADSVINDQEDRCRVEFRFAVGEHEYLVSRQRSRKGGGRTLLSFQALGEDGPIVLDGSSLAETQERIIERLGLTDELFCMTACVAQGQAAAFSEARPAERKGVLGEILRIGEWEKRAEIARRMIRDLDGRIEHMGRQAETARSKAAEADGLRDEIRDLNCEIEHGHESIAEHESELTDAQEAKTNIARDQEADRAKRHELEGLGEQVEEAQAESNALTSRLERFESSIAGKARVDQEYEQACAAEIRAEELETLRQQDEMLKHKAELLEQQEKAELAERVAAVRALKARILQLRKTHERDTAAFQRRVDDLTKQALPLESIPCADTDYESQCPLIELAREAKASLPEAEAEVTAALRLEPWAMDETELAEHHAASEEQETAPRLREIAAERKKLGYDAQEHEAAKHQAKRVKELEREWGQIQTAEAQMVEVQSRLDKAKAEAAELEQRKDGLEADLGKPRNWDAMLSAVESTIGEVRSAIAAAQAGLQELQQRRGSVQERLRGAEEAAEEAEKLAEELRTSERRLQVLKVLAQAFGKAGIPALLIEQAVPDLEAEANDVLTTLSDGTMSLELQSQRETKSNTLIETLDIVVSDIEGQRAYETFSGGERMRVDLALRIGLSVLLASRAGARIEMAVFDETCAPLDADGRAMFVECLSRITDRFATILVITHLSELRDAFPQQLDVSRNSHGSQFELVAG